MSRHNESWHIAGASGTRDTYDGMRRRVDSENGIKPEPGHTKAHPGFNAVAAKVTREYEKKGMSPAHAKVVGQKVAGKINAEK